MIPLAFFFWKVPFERKSILVTPWDYSAHDPRVPQKQYPVEIKARNYEGFFLSDIDTFRQSVCDALLPGGKSLLNRWRLWRLRAFVVTVDGKKFRVKLNKSIRKEIHAYIWSAQR
jgi:hypothetical protein